MRGRLTFGLLCSLILAGSSWAQNPNILSRVSQSVVKVEAGSAAASGFIWNDAASVVTALHVVDGQGPITVHYVDRNGRIEASSGASVARVLQSSDLVLLQLTQPQQRPPLPVNMTPPQVKQQLDAVGFPLNIAGISNTEVKVRFGGNQLRSILPPKALSKFTHYPSITEEILNLEGNLVPGLSGAPILDSNGHVVGIVDGGLENGAIGISWGIPSRYLQTLAASTTNQLPGAAGIEELFSADLHAEVGQAQELKDSSFIKLRSRTFEQLAEFADDQLGLVQLVQNFAMFDPLSFRYDIYQDAYSGATVVVPEGAELEDDGYFISAYVDDSRMHMKFLVEDVDGPVDAQERALLFEQELANPEYSDQVQVVPDPQWSYFAPMQQYGVLINRKAMYRSVLTAYGWTSDEYYFETLASNGETLLAVAAVNEDATPQTLQLELSCSQGMMLPDCQAIFEERRVWAQMVLGVQFASFPPQEY